MYNNDNIYKEIEYKNMNIEIYYSDIGEPDWDFLGQFHHWHRRYSLSSNSVNIRNYEPEEIKKILKDSIYVPVYMYDHSGVTINTTGFSCPWDSGQVGFYIVSKERVRKEYNVKRISKKLKEKIEGILTNEVKTYDDWMTGQVYGFRVLENGEVFDSCEGFYGHDSIEYAIDEAKGMIDYRTSNRYTKDYKQPSLFSGTS